MIEENVAKWQGEVGPLSQMIADEVLARLDARLLERGRGPTAHAARETVDLKEAARRLSHNYFWLSRNYRKLGLRPSRIGKKLLFNQAEIADLITRQKLKPRGRPRVAAAVQVRGLR